MANLSCPYCPDGELLGSVEIEHDLDEDGNPLLVEPEGSVLVCGTCLMAYDPSEEEHDEQHEERVEPEQVLPDVDPED